MYSWQMLQRTAVESAELVLVVVAASEPERFVAEPVDSSAVVESAVVADRWAAVVEFDSFAAPELVLELELVFFSMFDIAVEHKVAAVECKSVVVVCSLDFRR